jgi:hypothetical protein
MMYVLHLHIVSGIIDEGTVSLHCNMHCGGSDELMNALNDKDDKGHALSRQNPNPME